MTSQINGLNQAVRNANDAISMIQVAEGAMKEVTNMFQRMRELAVQSISDSNTASDRTALNNEYTQLSEEVQRVAGNTQWNGTNILDGARTNTTFQIGANASQTIDVNFGALGVNDLTATAVVTPETGGDTASFAVITLAGNGTLQDGDAISMKIDGTWSTFTLGTGDAAHIVGGTDPDAMVASFETTSSGYSATKTLANVASAAATLSVAAGGSANTFKLQSSAWSANAETFTVTDLKVTRGDSAAAVATDIKESDHAVAAIGILDTTLNSINSTRAGLGASMSRLEYASDNLQNVAQNTASARSRVMDADYAAETTELARTQIIQQASTAMLAQANQSQQAILALLGA
jgi:flagellin